MRRQGKHAPQEAPGARLPELHEHRALRRPRRVQALIEALHQPLHVGKHAGRRGGAQLRRAPRRPRSEGEGAGGRAHVELQGGCRLLSGVLLPPAADGLVARLEVSLRRARGVGRVGSRQRGCALACVRSGGRRRGRRRVPIKRPPRGKERGSEGPRTRSASCPSFSDAPSSDLDASTC